MRKRFLNVWGGANTKKLEKVYRNYESLYAKGMVCRSRLCVGDLQLRGALFWLSRLMTPYWRELLEVDAGATGFIMTFACLGVGCLTLLSGYLHPKIGTRLSFLIGTIILFACMSVANQISNIVLVYIWAFLNGAGTGFIYGPSLTTVQHWFPHRRGLATGIVNLLFGTSAAIMSPIYKLLFNALGYKRMNYVVLAMIIIINLLALLFAELPDRVSLNEEEKRGREEIMEKLRQAVLRERPHPGCKGLYRERSTVLQELLGSLVCLGLCGCGRYFHGQSGRQLCHVDRGVQCRCDHSV